MSHLYLQQPSRVFRVCKLAGVADIVSRAFERVYKPSNSLLVSVDTNQVQPTVCLYLSGSRACVGHC